MLQRLHYLRGSEATASEAEPTLQRLLYFRTGNTFRGFSTSEPILYFRTGNTFRGFSTSESVTPSEAPLFQNQKYSDAIASGPASGYCLFLQTCSQHPKTQQKL
jgi:hypothetical protein